ncbi:hypothetical protein GF323_06325 [Candidatus Woesearchaeota archaeon]|nr:hypothetical protein [Candidatus Woesearchaeota archaeon]
MDIENFYETEIRCGNLPSYGEFNSQFQIDDIEKGNFEKQISEKITEKTERFRKLMEEFLNPDGSSVAILMETKGMDDKYKEKINHAYKELIIIERNFALAELDNDKKSYFKFIEKSYDKWQDVRPVLKEIIARAKDSWKDENKVQEKLGYLG